MASALPGLQFSVRRYLYRSAVHKCSFKPIQSTRTISISPARWHEDPVDQARKKAEASKSFQAKEFLSTEKEIDAVNVDGEDWADTVQEINHFLATNPGPPVRKKKLKNTFLNDEDPDPWEEEEMMPDDQDDISALGYGELEHHREMRHYARLAAWEMPLLYKLAKPFERPTADMPLRFRYTSYMGEQHPAEKKVVLEFCPEDMPGLTEIQKDKLKKLVGPRYNPETDVVRMSCEMFETQAQNKRYLGDMVQSLLREAKDPKDTFEDVPLDTRHHRSKPRLKFPSEWAMTDARRAELEEYRTHINLQDEQKKLSGQLVDGVKLIEQEFIKAQSASESLPEMATVGLPVKGKRVAVRR